MSESYQKGRTGGVSGTSGDKRKGLAEKTIVAEGENLGGGADGIGPAASSIYSKAVKNGGGSDTGGDPALRQR